MIRTFAVPLLWLALVSTGPASVVNDQLIMSDSLPAKLSEFGLILGNGRAVTAGTPYALNTPLFSDYAEKFRFAYVPKGKTVAAGSGGVAQFPIGSVLVKSFGFPADFRKPNDNIRIIETRLLIHRTNGWVALPYVWDVDGRDATLKRAGARVDVSWIHSDGKPRAISYAVPNVNQCKDCHALSGVMTPIGPKPRNLTKASLTSFGIAQPYPLPVWNDPKTGSLNDRARAYLDVNCAHCHNRAGAASNSGLFLSYEEPIGPATGILKGPVAAGRGSGGFDHDVEPGHPEKSIMTFRMASLDPGIAMPESGRASAHDEGNALISQWIREMK